MTPGSVTSIPLSHRIHLLPLGWLVAVVALSASPELRIGDVQVLELAQTLRLLLVILVLAACGLRIPTSVVWRAQGVRFGLFLLGCASVSLFAVRLEFYPPTALGLLKKPFVLSGARWFELLLVIYFMIAIAETLRTSRRHFRIALDVYCVVATLSALLSIASFGLAQWARIPTPFVYDLDNRARGFFNEGGPFGIFIASAMVACLLRTHLFRNSQPSYHRLMLGTLVVAMLLSRSKGAILVVACLCLTGLAFAANRRQKLLLACALLAVLGVFVSVSASHALGYIYDFMNIDEMMAMRPGDPSLIMGRVTGALIVPRIVAAHPLLGVGLGNYSLVRNDPEYLQGLPPVDEWDLSGMGLIGVAAELGVPLTLGLLVLLLMPLLRASRTKAGAPAAAAAAFQPLALLFGVNLNFFYPWLMASFVLAAIPAASIPARRSSEPMLNLPPEQQSPSAGGGNER